MYLLLDCKYWLSKNVCNNHNCFFFIFQLENQIHNVLPKLPAQLQEMATKMLSKDVDARPFVKNLLHTPYFW